MNLIGIVGFIGSGKDTVANKFVEAGCVHDSFANPLKDVCASTFGWDRNLLEGDSTESREFRETPDIFWTRKTGIPNFTPRLALQLLGTDVMRNHFHQDIWIDSLEYRLRRKGNAKCVVISDARFRNELDLIKNLDGKIIWVQREELPEWYETAKTAHSNAISRKIMETKYKDVHESEWNWAGYDVDYVIKNVGTLEDLYKDVLQIQQDIFKSALKLV
jgi:hypothetical protein